MGQFLLEFLFDVVIRGALSGTVRFVGVCVLYFIGIVRELFQPSKKSYTIKELWAADFNKKDPVMMSSEKTGQTITGLFFIGISLFIILY